MDKEDNEPVATVEDDGTLKVGEGLVVNIDTGAFNVGDKLFLSMEYPGTLVATKQ